MQLLTSINHYLRTTGMTESRFGREAIGDGRLLHDLRGGRELRPRTLARVQAFMERSR